MARTTDTVVGQVLPGGGVPGAVLTKASAASGDAVWSLPTVVPPLTPIVQGDTLIYQTVNGVLVPLPATQLQFPANPRQQFEVESMSGLPDGQLVNVWPDVSGNGLDITAAGAARPTLITQNDGVRAVRFDGVANVLRRLGMPAVNTPDLVVFMVATTFSPVSGNLWTLAAASLGSGAGAAMGFMNANGSVGARANNLGGATLRGPGFQTLDSSATTAGSWFRLAHCLKWGNTDGPVPGWGQYSLLGGNASFNFLSGVPVGTNFNFTHLEIAAEGNGGGPPIGFALVDCTFFSYYEGAAAAAINLRDCWMTLEKLRARYRCL